MNGDEPLEVVPVRHYRQWLAAAGVALGAAMLVHALLAKIPTGLWNCVTTHGQRRCSPVLQWRFHWDVVSQYFTTSPILRGLLMTIELTVLSMVAGILIGIVVAVMRLSRNRLLSSVAWSYTWFFRGTPVLVQLIFWFNIAALFPTLGFGIPFGTVFFKVNVLSVFTKFVSVLVALALNEGAYMSEIVRGGILAVDEGQVEAASSLGLTRLQTMRLVVLPQAMRVIIPPTGNEVISMLKTTSLASTVALGELLMSVEHVYNSTYQVIPLLIVASLWYIVISTVLSVGQFYVERHYAKGSLRTPPPTPVQRLRADLSGIGRKLRERPSFLRTATSR